MGDLYHLRGLPIDWQNGFKIDGNPFISYGITMSYENLERVELLKGLGGFMYGFAQPGGVVNYVTKKPGKDPVTSFDFGYRMVGVLSQHANLSRRFGPDGMFGARINYTHEEGKTCNAGNINRNSVALALDGQLTRDLGVYFNAIHQQSRSSGQTPSIYIPGSYVGSSLPATISDGSKWLSGTDQHLNTNLQLYTAGVKYQFSPDWTFSTSASYSKSTRDRNESTLTLTNQAGDYTDSRWNGDEGHQDIHWQGTFEGKVKTGPLTHQLVLGGVIQRRTDDYGTAAGTVTATLGVGNLYEPDPYRYYSGSGLQKYRASEINQKSLFASDTVQLTSRWSVLAGVRYTNCDQQTYSGAGATTTAYDRNGVVTPTFALMYKLDPLTTVYTSYVESLEAGQVVADTYANAGSVLNPLRSREYEVGIKTGHERWSANAALFRIERGATYANSQNVLTQDGDSIYEGGEAGGSVRLGRNWLVGGDVMLLDTWYAKGQTYNGKRLAGAPQFTAAARVSYDVPVVPGLQLGADAKYTGNTAVRPAGDLETGGYLLVNVGANCVTRIGGHDVTLRAAIDNVTNRRYWAFQYDSYIAPGEPRTVSAEREDRLLAHRSVVRRVCQSAPMHAAALGRGVAQRRVARLTSHEHEGGIHPMSYTLYYSPGAASMAVHWMLLELGVPFETKLVDINAGAQHAPEYLRLNPAARVPTLVVDGAPHVESTALLMLLADRHPEAGLAPSPQSPQRADWLELMIFLANSVLPAMRGWFYAGVDGDPAGAEAVKAFAQRQIEGAMERLDHLLADGRPTLLKGGLSTADFHAVMLMRWTRNMPRPATSWPHLSSYIKKLRARPAFIELNAREGLTEWRNEDA